MFIPCTSTPPFPAHTTLIKNAKSNTGTNPLCFGIPTTDPYPFVIDCATSVNQRGKIEKYARDGKDTPRGAVIDRDGVERTDTEGILRDMVLGKCALTPVGGAGDEMGGYKGELSSVLFCSARPSLLFFLHSVVRLDWVSCWSSPSLTHRDHG